MPLQTQVAVVGAGAAGLYTALCVARAGGRVTLISAAPLAGSSSYWAQGGLAAAVAAQDSAEQHLADLAELGVRFDADRHGRLALGLEGGHSARRIVHAGGAATGRRLIRALSALVAEHPRIDVLEDRRVVGLISDQTRCRGVWIGQEREPLLASATVLATGGAAALWSRTTNPSGATGGGLLLAYLAGARLADLEFVQFHPTAVAAPNGADGFLVTEAVRGEGATLIGPSGERFVDELAPRDEVARAIAREMTAAGVGAVHLDMRAVDPGLFPNVVSALRESGIDPERELVPVSPAAHYMMGGIATDLDARSTLTGLYAVGECSDTGLHGANRLASNSLTECFVFGARAARAALAEPALSDTDPGPSPTEPPPRLTEESRRALWENAGIERDGEGLATLTDDPHPLVRLIGACALAREESRGAHQRRDFPDTLDALTDHHVVVSRERAPRLEAWH